MLFAFGKAPPIRLICKLVPVQDREYKYDLLGDIFNTTEKITKDQHCLFDALK